MILDEIVLSVRKRYEDKLSKIDILKESVKNIKKDKDFFYNALKKKDISFICEIKTSFCFSLLSFVQK